MTDFFCEFEGFKVFIKGACDILIEVSRKEYRGKFDPENLSFQLEHAFSRLDKANDKIIKLH
jgi:Txe/YoeB family toxin of Txe-Axe toxin-antitoxin module